MDKKVKFAEYQQRLDTLVEKTSNLLQKTGNEDLAKRLKDELDKDSERTDLRLAFVGQYSAGKSTIISALTGNKDIKIDANVATDSVSEYRWNNIILMDTPGILAGKVEAHDERTKEALSQCDLIFYVLTSQLFDDVVFNNFVDLAFNQHFANKMFIVVNKMGMEAGDYDLLVDTYQNSLRSTFEERGYNLSQFPIAFIDANDYITGEEEHDDEFVQLSHFEQFIDMLNLFVQDKGVIKKRFDTPVRNLQVYTKEIEATNIDPAMGTFYRQFCEKLNNSQRDTKRDVQGELYSFVNNAMGQVINLSHSIGHIPQAEWEAQQHLLDTELTNLINTTSNEIEAKINLNYETLLNEVEEFSKKDAVIAYNNQLEIKSQSPNLSIEEKKGIAFQQKTMELLKNGGEWVTKLAPGVKEIGSGISSASGSALHKGVYSVGKFFGHNFKPWQAVRWSSNIAKFAKFGIPVVTTGFDIWMQMRDARAEDRRLAEIKGAKSQFITNYQTEIDKIKRQFEHYLGEVLQNYIDKRNEINASIDEIHRVTLRNDQISNEIKELEGEYADFIEIIDE